MIHTEIIDWFSRDDETKQAVGLHHKGTELAGKGGQI